MSFFVIEAASRILALAELQIIIPPQKSKSYAHNTNSNVINRRQMYNNDHLILHLHCFSGLNRHIKLNGVLSSQNHITRTQLCLFSGPHPGCIPARCRKFLEGGSQHLAKLSSLMFEALEERENAKEHPFHQNC